MASMVFKGLICILNIYLIFQGVTNVVESFRRLTGSNINHKILMTGLN